MPPAAATEVSAGATLPPPQPRLPCADEQSTSCCSLSPFQPVPADATGPGSTPVATKAAPSSAPVAAKDQQEPHWPWFLTGVTAPAVTQLTEPGAACARRPAGKEASAASPGVGGGIGGGRRRPAGA